MEHRIRIDLDDAENNDKLSSIMKVFLKKHREIIIKSYNDVCGYDVQKEWGNINDWFGMGSVTCYELPCETMISCIEDGIFLTIRSPRK